MSAGSSSATSAPGSIVSPPGTPIVGVIMGSQSDWDVMFHCASTLVELGVPFEAQVVSAHRTPKKLYDYATRAEGRGLKDIVAAAGV